MQLDKATASVEAWKVRIALAEFQGPEDRVREVTCEDCPHNGFTNGKKDCDCSWDLYNTDGDCLAIK